MYVQTPSVRDEKAEADLLATACGDLPRAIRISVKLLFEHPDLTPGVLANELFVHSLTPLALSHFREIATFGHPLKMDVLDHLIVLAPLPGLFSDKTAKAMFNNCSDGLRVCVCVY
jgi:hypothetical protein